METVDVRRLERPFVIRFGCEGTRIHAYTLATILVSEAALLERFSGTSLDALLKLFIRVETVALRRFGASVFRQTVGDR